jgi:uncharacterized membrane protein
VSGLFLFLTSFLATGVEMVEALTIILATGVTRGWKSTFVGAGAAALILTAAVAAFGATLASAINVDVLRVIVGTFLLIFGLQWLRKAILRYGGLMAYHDEAAIYTREVRALSGEGVTARGGLQLPTGWAPGEAVAAVGGLDWQAFVVAFKGVLLEGLEAVFIVITFGLAASKDATLAGLSGIGLASVGGGAALLLVVVAGLLLHRPLSTVPENTMKMAVGLLLISFGTFWAGEGIGVEWSLGDVMILVLLGFYGAVSWAMVGLLRRAERARLVAKEVAR